MKTEATGVCREIQFKSGTRISDAKLTIHRLIFTNNMSGRFRQTEILNDLINKDAIFRVHVRGVHNRRSVGKI